MTKIFLLRKSDCWVSGPVDDKKTVTHYAGAPFDDPENLNKARVFKTAGAAKLSNEFKHWGYREVVEAQIKIELV
jgi:hypothetical protein